MSIKEKYSVRSIPNDETKEWLLYKHYAKRIPSIVYSFGLFNNGIMVGVCTYGIPPAENCQLLCGEKYKENTIELNRLIKNDDCEKNTQSWFVAQTFRLLPKPLIILSYSDPNNGHIGYTYQVLNFLFTGKGGSPKEYVWRNQQLTSRHIKDYWFKGNNLEYSPEKTIDENFLKAGGIIIPMEPKNRYIIFLGNKRQKEEMMKLLIWDILPYPKGDNQRYDTSYKPTVSLSLFQ